jgi:TolB-like protein/Flp pilus assembly protein TadD
MSRPGFFAELRRRNVLRAGVLYAGAVWALAQGLAQLLPLFGSYDWIARWFVVAGVVGFPFWVAFAWFYEFTPGGLKRESEIDPADSVAHRTGRAFDLWIIGVLTVAVVLLLTDRFVLHKGGEETAAIPAKSIAVLPLANASGDKDQVYFSDGLSEDLINALSQFAGLKVISRNSSFQFRDSQDDARTIGAKLGVAHLLEGSVRHAGDTVRITAQLVNAADGSTLWSEQYDRPFKDLFALQDEITRAVASALKAQLLPGASATAQGNRPPSGNLDAYTAFLQGRQYARVATDEASYLKAIDANATAIRLDPRYASAYASQAIEWVNVSSFRTGEPRQQAISKARAAADTALALNPDSAAVHNALGTLRMFVDQDWAGAEAEFRRAIQLDPGSAGAKGNLANLLSILGRPAQAVDLLHQSLAIDPLHPMLHSKLADALAMLGRLDEAGQAVRKVVELQPTWAPLVHGQRATIEILRGNAKAALAEARQIPEAGGYRDTYVAQALQIGPDRAAADAALKAQIDTQASEVAYQIAEMYALRKDADNTFVWLDRALANKDPGLQSLLSDPFLKPYWHDSRFAALAHKLGLPVPGEKVPGTTAADESPSP